jgi:Uma2 family endonuclease
MTVHLPKRLTADEFIAWAMGHEGRFELEAGEVVAMAPERAAHARTKGNVYAALRAALAAGDGGCEAFPDGMAVRIDASTVYEPDASLRCGPPLPDDATLIEDPVVVVEVLSPSTQDIDTSTKLAGYFRLPSLRHYLIVKTAGRTVIHHRRDAAGRILTTLRHDGDVPLDPPAITLPIASLFDPAR